MPRDEDVDLYVAYNGIDWSVQGDISAIRDGDQWDVILVLTVNAQDPYDWEARDVRDGTYPINTPVGLTQETIGMLHVTGIAQEYQRSGSFWLVKHYSLPYSP